MLDYSPREERLNVLTHAFGLILSVLGLFLLWFRANFYDGIWHSVGFGVFGVSLVVLYAASTFYHYEKDAQRRMKLKIFDHVHKK